VILATTFTFDIDIHRVPLLLCRPFTERALTVYILCEKSLSNIASPEA